VKSYVLYVVQKGTGCQMVNGAYGLNCTNK
jgi:hypothetical protein